jgi:hypothetical protein
MSQAHHENIDVSDPTPNTGTFLFYVTLFLAILIYPCCRIGDQLYPPPSAQNQESKGISDHVDGSGPIFSMYSEMAAEEDKKMAESWKDDADGILIFVRRHLLFLKYSFTLTCRS